MRWGMASVVVSVMVFVPSMASADPPDAIGHVEVIGGWTCHRASDCDGGLAEGSLGYGLRLTDRAEVFGRLTGTAPHGVRDGRDAASVGGGGDAALRWHPLPSLEGRRPLLDPFVELSAGALVHADRWPPGGSHYILRRGGALGLTLRLDAIEVSAGLRQQHLSNGQGLGAHNPAFDGLGGFVALGFAPHPVPAPLEAIHAAPAAAAGAMVLQTQVSLVEADGELGPATRLEARLAFSPGGWSQLRLDAGRLVEVDYVGGEMDVAWQSSGPAKGGGLVGLTAGIQSFAGLVRKRLAAQGEWYVDDFTTVAAQAAYATHTLAADAFALRAQWWLYPVPWLAFGAGLEHTWGDAPTGLDAVAPVVSAEVAPPFLAPWGLSLLAEREVDGLRVFSLRYTTAAPAATKGWSLRDRHRRGGMQVMR